MGFVFGVVMLLFGAMFFIISCDAKESPMKTVRLVSIITVIVGAIITFHYGKNANENEREYLKNNCVLVGNYPRATYMCEVKPTLNVN